MTATAVMEDVFISYATGDRDTAREFAQALQAAGCSVWWDQEIPLGQAFDDVIEQHLNAAHCVVVLWTKGSVESQWVKSEAATAAERNRLVPALLDDVPIPLEFRRIQTAKLQRWSGDTSDPEFVRLIQSVQRLRGEGHVAEQARLSEAAFPAPQPKTAYLKRILWGGGAVVVCALLFFVVRSFLAQQVLQSHGSERDVGSDKAVQPRISPSSPTDRSRAGTKIAAGTFVIKVGDRIEDGIPAPGAGHLETAGATDTYAFNAAPEQRVYFRVLRYGSGMEQVRLRLVDTDGTEVFNTCLACPEPGARTLHKGGIYTLTVGTPQHTSPGAYALQLYDVPSPQEFTIKIGDSVRANTPTRGAGVIETPGAKDIYSFMAQAEQRVYFRMLDHDPGMEQIRWRVTDADDNELFNTCLGCPEPGAITLRKAGTYLLAIGSDRNAAVGNYRFQLFDVPSPQRFSINVGDVVKVNSPKSGAGAIETPGAEDVYSFTARAGQRLQFRVLSYDSGVGQIRWRLTDPERTELFNTCLACTMPSVQVVTKAGTYRLTVGSRTNAGIGRYRIQIVEIAS